MNAKKTMTLALAVLTGLAAEAKERVLVVSAHPDDTIAIAGTLCLMKDRFEIHVADLTKGERGLGEAGFRDGSTAATRMVEEENAAKMIGATVHWLGFTDGELYATPEACKAVADLIAELAPRAVFAMWPIDRHQDHSMAGTITLKAARLAKYAGEFYYYEEVYGSKGFVPMHFVDVSSVIALKQRYTRRYVCQNKNDYMNRVEMEGAKGRGYKSFYDRGRQYAECFAPLSGFRVQGTRCIFDELPLVPEPAHVVAKIEECDDYAAFNPRLAKAFEFLKRKDLAELKPGRYEIDGSNCWAMVQEASLVPLAERKVEAHRKFIDIQAPITGPEAIGLCELDEGQLALPFNEKRDCVLFPAPTRPVTLQPGEFGMFFPPKGGHAPGGRAEGGPEKIRKLVIKIRAD